MSTLPRTTDVLIAGAGPTGLALATTLAQAGVDHVIADKLEQGQGTSRAAVVHAHTLEVLDSIGVAEAMVQEGLRLPAFSLRDRDTVLARLPFDRLPSRYAFLLMIGQDRTEVLLERALAAAGGRVFRGTVIESLVPSTTSVTATVRNGDARHAVQARWVVGADGMHSVVRESAGIGFPGEQYEESFVLADVEMTWPHGRDEVMLFLSPAGLVVVAPLPGGRTRIVATMDDAPAQPQVADIQALFDARGPRRGRAQVTKVIWGSRFRIHHRLAEHYRRGRLLLVGDAAHVHSPAGGQGMNTGLVDACVLGRLLARAVKSGDDACLDQYETLRRPAAAQVLQLAGRLTRLATARGLLPRFLRNTAFRAIGVLPPARQRLLMNLSGLARRPSAAVAD